MSYKFNPSRYNVTFAGGEVLQRPSEIEGLVTQRGAANSRDRVSAQREHSSKSKQNPKSDVYKGQKAAPMGQGFDRKVRSFNQSESSDDGKSRHCCPSHPNKKAKYFLATNPNIGFCTKCAITMSERETLIDQEKLIKITRMDRFKQDIRKLRETITSKQQQVTNVNKTIGELLSHEMHELGERFEKMFKSLTQKYESMVAHLQQRYEQVNRELAECQHTLDSTSTAVDNYTNDVSKNYDGILNDLSVNHFNEIMAQYKQRVDEQMRVVEACEVRGLEIDHQMELLDLHGMIGRMSLPEKMKRQSLRARLENKQNNMNMVNCEKRQSKPCRV